MASIAKDPGGQRRLLFVGPDKKRRTIRLGKVSQRMAEAVKFRVEQLLAAKLTGHAIDADTARWVANLPDALADKLARVGLILKREPETSTTLGVFLAEYFERRTDVKRSTILNWRHTRRCLLRFFGEERGLESITAGEAKDWERWLRSPKARENAYAETPAESGLAANTVRKRVSNAKQFFADAVSRDLIVRNQFAGLKGSVGSNRARDYFITCEEAGKVLDACPDNEWRLIFALSRFGGLRCPSEHLALTWADVDWGRERIRVRSPKTEHHEGGASRWMPLFPELKPYLEEAWEQAQPGSEFVIARYRNANTNLRTTLNKIIRRAGLEPWPKLFQNLRATRETELAQSFPIHVVCAWIGNSQAIATKHYLQVTDDHYLEATKPTPKAAQKAAQQAHAGQRTESQTEKAAQQETPVLPGFASGCDSLHKCSVGDTGLEPVTPSLSSDSFTC